MTAEIAADADTPAFCRGCEGRTRGICGAMNRDYLERLSQNAVRREAGAGQELLSEDQLTRSHAKIISGVVKLSKLMSDGRQQIVGLQFAPDFIGRPFSIDVSVITEAATPVKVCVFPRAVVEKLMKDMPGLEHRLFEQSLDQLDDARDWMLTLGRKTAGERVASFLLMIATRSSPINEKNRAEFDLPMKREDIADFLGLTVETISRQLTRLRKTKVITIEHSRHVVVPDLQRLANHAGL